jgi:serine O-acetyltransferase
VPAAFPAPGDAGEQPGAGSSGGMGHQRLQNLKRMLRRVWVLSPDRLWLASIALSRNGHWVLAFWLKHLNGLIYHNSLSPGARVGSDVWLGHNGLGIVVNPNVEIGDRVAIWHHVTLSAGRPDSSNSAWRRGGRGAPPEDSRAKIVVESNVVIGAGVIVVAPRGRTLTIGHGSRIGAGTVITSDVAPRTTVVGPEPRVVSTREPGEPWG